MRASVAGPVVQLGLRWAVPRQGAARRRALALAAGAAVASLVVMLSLGLVAGSASREYRARQMWPEPGSGAVTFRMTESVVRFREDTMALRFVAPERGLPPVPPGLDHFPGPGEVVVSPAFVAMLAQDPGLARRLPGTPQGVISARGLDSPDQLLAYVGRPRGGVPQGFLAAGWGAGASGSDRPVVPVDGLAVIVVGLVGVPLVAFGLVVARMSAATRRRRIIALHLLGVPARSLGRATAVETAVTAAVGASVGVLVAAVCLPVIASRGLAGITWFATDTPLGTVRPAIVVGLVAVALAVGAAAGTKRVLAAPVGGGPAGGRRDGGMLRFLPAAAGAGVLAGYVALGTYGRETVALASGPFALLGMVALLATVAGAVLALAPALAVVARFGRRLVTRPSTVLAMRRLEFDAAATARSAVGIVLLFVTGFLGLAALADVRAQSGSHPQGWLMTVQPSHAYGRAAQRALTTVPAEGLRLDLGPDSSPRWVATCSSLATFAGITGAKEAAVVRRDCVDGSLYWLSGLPGSAPPAGIRGSLAPGLLGGPLGSEAAVYRTLPPSAVVADDPNATLYALVGRDGGVSSVERYVTGVLAADPQARITVSDEPTLAKLVPVLERLVVACLALGLAIALAAFLLASHDQQQERRRHTAALLVMGVPRSVRAIATAAVHLTAGATACLVGAAVGTLSASAYLSMTGDPLDAAGLHGRFLAFALVALTVVVLGAGAEIAFADREVHPELVRRA